jgi:hypothetical protein
MPPTGPPSGARKPRTSGTNTRRARPNPSAAKAAKTDEKGRVSGYTKKDGTRVRSHTRSAQWARSRKAAAGAAFAGISATMIFIEFGFTLISTLSVIAIALLTTVAVFAGDIAERNKKTMGRQARSRSRSRSRARSTASRSRTRASSPRRR